LLFRFAPVQFNNKRARGAQISRDIGVRFTPKSMVTHNIAPDTDEAPRFVVRDLWNSQVLLRFAFVSEVGSIRRLLLLVLTCLPIYGCIGPIKHEMTLDYPAAVLRVVGTPPVVDGRTRFREIFCQLLDAEHQAAERPEKCEDYLLRLNDEPVAVGESRPPPEPSIRYQVIVVPDFLSKCLTSVVSPFEDAIALLRNRGVKVDALVLDPSTGDAAGAHLDETIQSLNLLEDDHLILVGYSTGVVYIMNFLVNYPATARQVDAVISVAGIVNGTPLAAKLDGIYTDLARGISPGHCDAEGDGAFESLLPTVRLSWLAAHPLPKSVRYFSLAAMTQRDSVNSSLKTGYDLLWIYSPRNDGVVLIVDQLIPGGTLLGYANADHWSVALPLEGKNRAISDTLRAASRFPRGVLLHALLVYATEALESKQEYP
jgi:hypothetical protein